jgi:hypothetical protein
MAQPQDPAFLELAERYATVTHEAQATLDAIQKLLASNSRQVDTSRLDLEKATRDLANAAATAAGELKLLTHDINDMATKEAKRVSAELSGMISRSVSEAIGSSVEENVETAIRNHLGPEIERHSKDAITMVNGVTASVNALRTAIVKLRIVEFVNATGHLAVWVLGIGIGIAALVLSVYFAILRPLESKETIERSTYLMIAATQFDDEMKAHVDAAYKRAIKQAKEAVQKNADQLDLERIAQEKAEAAAKAKAAADLALEIQHKQEVATKAAQDAAEAAKKVSK